MERDSMMRVKNSEKLDDVNKREYFLYPLFL